MIKVNELSLLDVASKSTLTDENTNWIYQAIDYAIKRKNEKIKDVFNLIDRIHFLEEKEIELLLWEYHVDGSNETNTIEEKRILILESLLTHMKKGTLGIVKQNCDLLFGTSFIEEWYTYGGKAGTFRVSTSADTQRKEIYDKILKVIENTKNVRSHLESVSFIRENIINIYNSIGIHSNIHYTIEIGG